MLSLTICTFVESVWARIPYRGECQKPVIMSMVQDHTSFSPSTPLSCCVKAHTRAHSIVPLADQTLPRGRLGTLKARGRCQTDHVLTEPVIHRVRQHRLKLAQALGWLARRNGPANIESFQASTRTSYHFHLPNIKHSPSPTL